MALKVSLLRQLLNLKWSILDGKGNGTELRLDILHYALARAETLLWRDYFNEKGEDEL